MSKIDAKKRDRILNLYSQSVPQTLFICDKCEEEETIQEDAEDAAALAYDEGWRATDRNTYCKKCAKKYLR